MLVNQQLFNFFAVSETEKAVAKQKTRDKPKVQEKETILYKWFKPK